MQFNLYVVPVQGRLPPLPMMEAKETCPDDPDEIQDDPRLFRILSGTSRIQWEMGVCCYTQQCTRELLYQQTTADPCHVQPQQQHQPNSSVLLLQ